MEEIKQSLRILEQALEQFPEDGEIMGKVPRVIRPPEGEVYAAIESPRGEIGCYIISRGKARAVPFEIPQTFLCESANFAQAAGRRNDDQSDYDSRRHRYCRWGGGWLMVNLLEESLTWTNFLYLLFWGIVMLLLVLGFRYLCDLL